MKKKGQTNLETQESFAILGMAVHLLHQIEDYFAQATLLGLTEKQRRKHKTINDMWDARDRMTFGQLVVLFKEDWLLDPDFERLLDTFVSERNVIAHRITTLEGYGVATKRERKKLNSRLSKFIEVAFFMRRVFFGAYLTSNEFAREIVKEKKGIDIPLETPDEWEQYIECFRSVADYRHSAQQGAVGDTPEAHT